MEFEPVIGLEVHAQLLTKSKIFCGCSTQFGSPPNSNTCPVCLGLPGALPVLNRQAVEMAMKTALALGCRINQRSIFARKNYFYPDLPKGYQISQFDLPLAEEGKVCLLTEAAEEIGRPGGFREQAFRIIRLHLEEDAGKSVHQLNDDTLVNLNRTGVPLVEIVTHADFRSPRQAFDFLQHLRRVLRYLEVCDGNMEEGSLRCDANVSVRRVGEQRLGTKTEIKNLNSFRFLKKALEYEIQRQIQVVSQGQTVLQETLLWNDVTEKTQLMRSKEEAHDYRYFPDPDLLPVVIEDEWLKRVRESLPELPESKRRRFVSEYELEEEAALVLTQERSQADYFEAAMRVHRDPKGIYNWMVGELTRGLKRENLPIEESPVSPEGLGALVRLVAGGTISGKIAKSVFEKAFSTGCDPAAIVAEEGLEQISDTGELEKTVDQVLADHPEKVKAYRDGKEGLLGFFVGQVMRKTQGRANPQLVNETLRLRLQSDR